MSDLATPPKRRPLGSPSVCVHSYRAHTSPRSATPRDTVPRMRDDVRHVLTRITTGDGRRGVARPSLSPARTIR